MIISLCYLTFYATSGSSIKSQVLDLNTLHTFSPLKIYVSFDHTGTGDSQNLTYKTLATAEYEFCKISSFTVLDLTSWLKEDDDLHTDHL